MTRSSTLMAAILACANKHFQSQKFVWVAAILRQGCLIVEPVLVIEVLSSNINSIKVHDQIMFNTIKNYQCPTAP